MENIKQVSNFIKKIEPKNTIIRRSFNSRAKKGTIYVLIGFSVDDNSFKKELRKEFHKIEWKFFFSRFEELAKITNGECEFFVRFVSPKINLPEFSNRGKSAPC